MSAPIPLGAKVAYGRGLFWTVAAVGSFAYSWGHERYYWLTRGKHEAAMVPASVLEEQKMKDSHYRALLDLRMCSDPFPESVNLEQVDALVNYEAHERDFENWVVAYHEFKPGQDSSEKP